MSDLPVDRWHLPPAFDKATLERYAANAESFQRREVKRAHFVSRLLIGYSAAATALVLLLIATLSYTVPNVRLKVLPIWTRADGTVDYASNESALPATITEAQTRAWLWQYVRLRETYAYADARDNYDVVSAMSAPDVRDRFQQWYNNKTPDTPAPSKLLGKDGTIRVSFRDSELVDDRFTVRFCRFVSTGDGQRALPQPMIATLHFQVLTKISLSERIQYNPNALVVTSYPGAYPQGQTGQQAAPNASAYCGTDGGV